MNLMISPKPIQVSFGNSDKGMPKLWQSTEDLLKLDQPGYTENFLQRAKAVIESSYQCGCGNEMLKSCPLSCILQLKV